LSPFLSSFIPFIALSGSESCLSFYRSLLVHVLPTEDFSSPKPSPPVGFCSGLVFPLLPRFSPTGRIAQGIAFPACDLVRSGDFPFESFFLMEILVPVPVRLGLVRFGRVLGVIFFSVPVLPLQVSARSTPGALVWLDFTSACCVFLPRYVLSSPPPGIAKRAGRVLVPAQHAPVDCLLFFGPRAGSMLWSLPPVIRLAATRFSVQSSKSR
jgi:hypothetical protein